MAPARSRVIFLRKITKFPEEISGGGEKKLRFFSFKIEDFKFLARLGRASDVKTRGKKYWRRRASGEPLAAFPLSLKFWTSPKNLRFLSAKETFGPRFGKAKLAHYEIAWNIDLSGVQIKTVEPLVEAIRATRTKRLRLGGTLLNAEQMRKIVNAMGDEKRGPTWVEVGDDNEYAWTPADPRDRAPPGVNFAPCDCAAGPPRPRSKATARKSLAPSL